MSPGLRKFALATHLTVSVGWVGAVAAWLETGPVRVARIVELDVAGHRVEAARREYRRLPSLRSIRFDVPGVRLVLHGWDLTFDELEHHAESLERLEFGKSLFRSMEAAQAWTTRRFDELHGREHGPWRTTWTAADGPNGR